VGRIVTLTGPSGVGKTTLARELLNKNPDWKLVLSLTSRKPRDSDLPGEYRSNVHSDEWRKREQMKEFLWVTSAHGNRYGTLRRCVDVALAAEHISLMLLTPDVIPTLLDYAPGKVIPLFIIPPGDSILRARLEARGDDPATLERRIADCKKWYLEALASGVPYLYITNSGPIEEAEQIIEELAQR
jgi:guanylate kinase